MLLDICYLFISQISTDPDIKNSKIHLPIMLGVSFFWIKKSPKGNFKKKRIFCCNFFYKNNLQENHKF
jgi:hypothetical protein